MSALSKHVRDFPIHHALVLGDVMLDTYCEGVDARLASEAPVPVVRARRHVYRAGGAANTAVNVRRLGASVDLLGVTGADAASELLRRELERHDVPTHHLIVDPRRPTTSKLRIYSRRHLVARLDEEDDQDLPPALESLFVRRLEELLPRCDVVVVSDYLKGTLTRRVVAELGRLSRLHQKLVVVDSKDLARRRFRNIGVVTPNHLEAQRVCSPSAVEGAPDDDATLAHLCQELLARVDTRWAIITLGGVGAFVQERHGAGHWVRARPTAVASDIGAGDAFTAALALALAAGAPVRAAARIAVEAAGIAVTKDYTAMVTAKELLDHLASGDVPDDGEDESGVVASNGSTVLPFPLAGSRRRVPRS